MNNSSFDSQGNEANFDDTVDTGTLRIVLPFIFGLFVALILGWMMIRYKMTTSKTSNYSGSIYCCPDRILVIFSRYRKIRVTPNSEKGVIKWQTGMDNRASQISLISSNNYFQNSHYHCTRQQKLQSSSKSNNKKQFYNQMELSRQPKIVKSNSIISNSHRFDRSHLNGVFQPFQIEGNFN